MTDTFAPETRTTPTTEFEDWLRTAKGGEVYVYATRNVLDPKTPQEILDVAFAARRAYARGEIELVQRRTKDAKGGKGPFQYEAQKRRQKIEPRVLGDYWQVRIIGANGYVSRR